MKKISFLIILILIASCIKKIETAGYSFDEINIDNIEVGITTKNTVLKELGSPSLKTNKNSDLQESWIYYSDVKNSYFFFRPKVKGRKVLALSFDTNDVVSSKEQCGFTKQNDTSKEIKIVKDFTKKEEKKDNIFMDIVNNIGTVRSM